MVLKTSKVDEGFQEHATKATKVANLRQSGHNGGEDDRPDHDLQ